MIKRAIYSASFQLILLMQLVRARGLKQFKFISGISGGEDATRTRTGIETFGVQGYFQNFL